MEKPSKNTTTNNAENQGIWRKNNPEKTRADATKKTNDRRNQWHSALYNSKESNRRCKKICMSYKAKKPVMGSRYDIGQVRCSICEIYLTEEGMDNYYCRCCHCRVRSKSRFKNAKTTHLQILQNRINATKKQTIKENWKKVLQERLTTTNGHRTIISIVLSENNTTAFQKHPKKPKHRGISLPNNPDKAKASEKKSYQNNPEKAKASEKKSYQNNPEKFKTASKKWAQDNPERAKNTKKKWRENNPEKVKATNKKWQQNHPEKFKASVKNWQKNNPEKVRAYATKRNNDRRKPRHQALYNMQKSNQKYKKSDEIMYEMLLETGQTT